MVLNARLLREAWKANAYVQRYAWDMFSNPTYSNPDGSSAQIHQFGVMHQLLFDAGRHHFGKLIFHQQMQDKERHADDHQIGK